MDNKGLTDYMRRKNIDSFQKLRLLLFLHQNPNFIGTSQEFAQCLHLGDTVLVEDIMAEFYQTGLINQIDNLYKLEDNSEVRVCLQHLAGAFEHPLTRQELLSQLKYIPSLSRYGRNYHLAINEN